MKQSRYNLLFKKDDRKLVFNQLSASILELDDILFNCLANNDIDIIPKDIKNSLWESSILVDNDLVEKNVVMYRMCSVKYNDNTIRVTIMPTLNCNFKCWYCYEKHHDSKMSEDGLNKVLHFCQELIENGNSKIFHLDWFGGEPLLYFYDIVYPIACKVKEICKLNGVTFHHSITTNGYLIDTKTVQLMKEINLSSFQITLDGAASYHNRTRFTDTDKNTYNTIVYNITDLCRKIPNIDMTVRINYTPKNILSVSEIVKDFPSDVRKDIHICPQLVWQFKKYINTTTDNIKDILQLFQEAGYKAHKNHLTCHQCYAESMSQYVINYDLNIFKCTARDFSQRHCIGSIREGKFVPNNHFFDYCVPNDFIYEKCASCELLPSCMGRCIQKRVEGIPIKCDKEMLKKSIINDVLLYISAYEKN